MSSADARAAWLFGGADPPSPDPPTRESAEEALARHIEAHNIDTSTIVRVERGGGGAVVHLEL